MISISIITQEDKFFIPKNIQLLISNKRINVKSIHIISSKGSLEHKKMFFLKSFLFAGSFRLSLKYVFHNLKKNLDKIFNYRFYHGDKSIKSIAIYNNIDFSYIKNPNDIEFTKYLKLKKIDFIVSYSAPSIFKDTLLKIPKYNCINLHCSLLPNYSGIMPSFWVLYFKEKFTGSSVHLMDSKIDNGKLVLQEKINIEGIKSIYKLNLLTKKIGGELMLKSIIGIVDKTISLIPNNVDESKYFTWPTNQDIKYFIKNGGRIY
jgi:methionyl-tRNA formyltransferase